MRSLLGAGPPQDPECYMTVFDVVGRLKNLMKSAPFATLMLYAEHRDEAKIGDDGDCWASSGLRETSTEDRRKFFFLKFCTDSAVMQTTLNVSSTPVVAELLNLPPTHRLRFASLILFGMIPKAGNYAKLYTQLLHHNAMNFEGGVNENGESVGVGFEIKDVLIDSPQQSSRRVKLKIAGILNDSRGLQPDLGCKQSPARCGGCPFCRVEGIGSVSAKMLYPCAMSWLPRNDPLRQAMLSQIIEELPEEEEEEEVNDPPISRSLSDAEKKKAEAVREAKKEAKKRASKMRDLTCGVTRHLREMCQNRQPALMKTQDAIEAAKRVIDRPSCRETEPYFAISPYLQVIPDLDLLVLACNDSAHAFGNLVKQILKTFCSQGKMNATAAKMEFERLLGRFTDAENNNLPFQATTNRGLMVEVIMRRLKSPQGWAKIRYYFSNPSNMKLVELLRVLSDTGVYYVTLLDLDPEYTRLFIELIQATEFLLDKEPMLPVDFSEATRRFVRALATCELMLPLFWNHIVIHLLLHEAMFMERFGVFPVRNMLAIEMMHTKLKRFAKSGAKNMSMTIARKYLLYVETEVARLDPRAMPRVAPASSLAGVRPDPRRDHIRKELPIGKATQVKRLSPLQFRQVLEAWGRLNKHKNIFDKKVLDVYKRFISEDRPKSRRPQASYWNAASWRAWFDRAATAARPPWTKEMLRFKYIPDTATFYTRASLDDTFFATKDYCDKRKYDDSYVEEIYNTWPNGNHRPAVQKTCYNRIMEIFTHCFPYYDTPEVIEQGRNYVNYLRQARTVLVNVAGEGAEVNNIHLPEDPTFLPENASSWTSPGIYQCYLCDWKTSIPHEYFYHNVGPNHVQQLLKPWSRKVFLDHDVYTPVPEEPVNPINNLPNVSRDLELEKGARVSFLNAMCAHNIVLWPRDPWADKGQAVEAKHWTVIRGRNLDYGLNENQ